MLQSLHWLPSKERIHFKVLLLTYKAVHGIGPAYLQELVTKHAPSRRLRSGAQTLLKPPSTVPNTITYGDRAFAQAAYLAAWQQLHTSGSQCWHIQITTDDIPFPQILRTLESLLINCTIPIDSFHCFLKSALLDRTTGYRRYINVLYVISCFFCIRQQGFPWRTLSCF